MTASEIKAFNEKLVVENVDITILDYVKLLNNKFYHIAIDFIDDFIDLVDKEGFVINHEMLFKYEILAKTSATNVLNSLNSYELEEHMDYELTKQLPDHGTTNKHIFMLTTDAFKIICIRSKNTKKFVKYYLLLEKSINYYSHYEKLKLEKRLKENNALKILKLSQSDTYDNFLIMKDTRRPDFQYGLIRGSDKNIRETMQDLLLTDENVIFKINVASSTNFTKKVKEVLEHKFQRQKVFYNKSLGIRYYEGTGREPDFEENERWLTSVNRWFKLIDITIDEFINKLQEINEVRFSV
jgi:hypothetical protein